MSNENKKKSRKRPYTLKARARRQEAVHRRITLAAVHLHETVGPARTTMNAIAERAGVRRATVYNHFRTDYELLDACSSHWFADNPPPDPTAWSSMPDPVSRTKTAFQEMYSYYERGHEMLEKVLRDAPLVPALEEILQAKWQPLMEMMVDVLVTAWRTPGGSEAGSVRASSAKSRPPKSESVRELKRRAILRIGLDFFTWQKVADVGLSSDDAADLMVSWIEAV